MERQFRVEKPAMKLQVDVAQAEEAIPMLVVPSIAGNINRSKWRMSTSCAVCRAKVGTTAPMDKLKHHW